MALLQQGIMAPVEQPSAAPAPAEQRSMFTSQRSRRQLSLFFAGAGFFALSTLITRRALVRRYQSTLPKFYQPSNRPQHTINGAFEAFEALNIATINVFSISMMTTGGLLYAFDISSLEDLRSKVRKKLGIDGAPTDEEAEKEIQEVFASILERTMGKEKSEKFAKEMKDAKDAKDDSKKP